jgi:nucleoid-associated protein YgaU
MNRQKTQIIVGAMILIGAFYFGAVAQRRHGDLVSPNTPPASLEKEDLVWHIPEDKDANQSHGNSSTDLIAQSNVTPSELTPSDQPSRPVGTESSYDTDRAARPDSESEIPQLLTSESPKPKPIVQPDFSSLASSLIAADSERMRPVDQVMRTQPMLAPPSINRDSSEPPATVIVRKSISPTGATKPDPSIESNLVPISNGVDHSLEIYTDSFRVHVTRYGDSLQSLARQYFGSPNFYLDIYLANQDTLTSPASVPIGVTLKIPIYADSKMVER